MAKKDKDNKDKSPFAAAVLTVVVISAFALSYYRGQQAESPKIEPLVKLDQISCEAAGGFWNACGSACRGAEEGVACITVCVPQCECADDNACPFGYVCGEKIEGVGICAAP